MTRALITGVTGCVGSHLAAALLRRGVTVTGLRYKNATTVNLKGLDVELIDGDIQDAALLQRAMQGVDWVFHVAAIADDWHYPAAAVYRTNVLGSYQVLRAAQSAGVERFVLTCSAAALGVPRPEKPLMDESCTFNLRPEQWVYGHSKVLAEQLMQSFVADGLHAVSVLPAAIMGPGDISFISGELVRRAALGETFPFPAGGANFIDVRDVAEAHIRAAECGAPGERFVLAGNNLSHLHCLGALADVMGVRINYLPVARRLLPAMSGAIGLLHRCGVHLPIDAGRITLSGKYMYYDNRKAVQVLGLKVRPFEQTVHDTYRWYLEHGLLKEPGRRQSRPPVLAPAESRLTR